MTAIPITTVEIAGLKSTDSVERLGRLNLITGDVGSGKSRVPDAVRFAALGYVPHNGRRESDTADLMRGNAMTVRLRLSDGKWVERTLRRKGASSFTSEAAASFVPEGAGPTETGEAIRALAGASDLDASESLDLNELLSASPQQFSARIDAILDATGMKPSEQIDWLVSLPAFRLAGIPQDRIPAKAIEASEAAVPLLNSVVPQAQRAALASATAEAGQVLRAKGVAEALTHATSGKNTARQNATQSRAARAKIEDAERAATGPALTLVQIDAQRQSKSDRLAVLRSQAEAAAKRKADVAAAHEAQRKAQADLDGLNAAGTPDARATALAAEAKELRTKAALLLDPPAPTPLAMVEEDAGKIEGALQLEDDARGLDATAESIAATPAPQQPTPKRLPDVDTMRVERAQRALALAEQSPWNEVRSYADQVRLLTVPQEQGSYRDGAADGLRALADTHGGGSVEALRRAIEDERTSLLREEHAREEVRRANVEAQAGWSALHEQWVFDQGRARGFRQDAGKKRQEATSIKDAERARVVKVNGERTETNRKARIEREVAADKVTRERRSLLSQADAKDAEAKGLTTKWTDAAAALATAVGVVEGLEKAGGGANPAPDEIAALQQDLDALEAQRQTVEGADVRKRQMAALLRDIDTAEALTAAWTAIEWALQWLRARDLADRSGPILEIMERFLVAAGRPEKPYLRLERGRRELGWSSGGQRVSVKALSGGESVLFKTAFAAAVLTLRGAALSVLIVEAAEVGIDLAPHLMAGCEAVADGLSNVVLCTCLPVEAREGWTVIRMGAAALSPQGV